MAADNSFGANLGRVRRRAGITILELSRRSGLHLGTVYRIEKNERTPSVEIARRLAAVLGVRIDDFYREDGLP
jgi:transcriptional regulator with XRE-family HTH domain